jgi:hypothetical protein
VTERDNSSKPWPEQFQALQREVAQLRAAERDSAMRRTRLQTFAGRGAAVAVLAAVLGIGPGKAFSSPASPTVCGAEHTNDLYCFAGGKPVRASEVNSNFEVLADDIDALDGSINDLNSHFSGKFEVLAGDIDGLDDRISSHTHPSTITWSDHFLQFGQSATLSGHTSSNSVCFVGRIDMPSTGGKCQAYLSGSQWMGYTEGSVVCNIRCLKW